MKTYLRSSKYVVDFLDLAVLLYGNVNELRDKDYSLYLRCSWCLVHCVVFFVSILLAVALSDTRYYKVKRTYNLGRSSVLSSHSIGLAEREGTLFVRLNGTREDGFSFLDDDGFLDFVGVLRMYH